MLKVSELRLGNLILHNGEVMPVVQIERRYKTIYRLNDMDVDEYASWTIYKAMQYLHQLQNLFFALTGEELAITDPVL